MNTRALKYLLYVWTRDAEYKVDSETEKYVIDHLKVMKTKEDFILDYSDSARAEMCERIIQKVNQVW